MKSWFYKIWFILLVSNVLGISSQLSAETVAYQGFEEVFADSWQYTADVSDVGYWGIAMGEYAGILPESGNKLWAAWNLDSEKKTVSFQNKLLPQGYHYSISFCYYTQMLNSDMEYCRYSVSYDDGNSFSPWIDLQHDTQAWTSVLIHVPTYVHQVKLRVATEFSGTDKLVLWDSFSLNRDAILPSSPHIENLQIAQRTDGSGAVDIHYDLIDAEYDTCSVTLLISDNAGTTFDLIPDSVNLSGDLGLGILPGLDKHIVWNAGNESYSLVGNQYRFRLMVDDGTVLQQVAAPSFNPPAGNYLSTQFISILCDTPGCTIRFTLDGSEPDDTSMIYTTPIMVNTYANITARAYKSYWQDSEMVNGIYTVVPAGFVYVPEGSFIMGDTAGLGNSTELPLHSVTLSPFYVSQYEVTQAEYIETMGFNPAHNYGEGANYPVYNVSWYSALKYCNLRSLDEGLNPVYSISGSTKPSDWGGVPSQNSSVWNQVVCNWTANGYRLPTEAEWEYAARGATNTPDYLYAGSNDLESVAWHLGNNTPIGAKPVGLKLPNGLNLYDMTGNVYELCWDWYDPNFYSYSTDKNPHGPDWFVGGIYKILRGGQFSNTPFYCRVSLRNYDYYGPSNVNFIVGFRVFRSAL